MSRKPKKESSNPVNSTIVDIHQLSDNARENQLKTDFLRMEQHNVALSQTIDQLLKKLEDKELEIMHLQQMLGKTVPIIGNAVDLHVTDEEVIASIQLQKLKDNAKSRELTLDEIKKFDLLVKNKRLAQGNATTIEGKKLPQDTPKGKLMQIAAKKIESKGE